MAPIAGLRSDSTVIPRRAAPRQAVHPSFKEGARNLMEAKALLDELGRGQQPALVPPEGAAWAEIVRDGARTRKRY